LFLTVHVDLGLLANIDYQTEAVVGVFKCAATEQEIFDVTVNRLFHKASVSTAGI
jgi:hypothetical protein